MTLHLKTFFKIRFLTLACQYSGPSDIKTTNRPKKMWSCIAGTLKVKVMQHRMVNQVVLK